MKSVGIVGGSVIGLSTASAILQNNPELKIVVYSEVFTPHTTADVSSGLVSPYLIGEDESVATIQKWAKDTFEYLVDFGRNNDEASGAITLLSGYQLWKNKPKPGEKIDDFRDCVMGWRDVDQSELDRISSPGRYAYGVFFTAIQCNCTKYLPYLMKNLAAKGVTFIEKKILSLDDVADQGHDIVINTTGFFAKHLTDDPKIRPYRGQVLTAEGPWIKHFFIDMDGDSYIIPKSGYLVVGGTHDGDSSLTIRKDVSDKIWKDAHLMVPNLKGGTVIGERVGIRPGRS